VMRQFDWERAEVDYRAALAADPRDAGVRQWYGEFLTYQRRWDDAHAQYGLALASDPLAAILYTSYAMALHAQGEHAASVERFEQAQRLNPDFTAGRVVRVASLAQSGRLDLAAAVAAEATGDERAALAAYVEAMRDPARVAAGIGAVRAHGADTLISKPLLLASLGRHDLALTELERLTAAGDPYRVFLYAMTAFDPLHGDPRFRALLAQIGLPRPASP
jgi:tetratricopeptide (TPR) repeat protein